MRGEFNRIYWAMLNSDTIAGGEYYVIHADHIHDFKMAIDNYLESNKESKVKWEEKESLAGVLINDKEILKILARRTEKLKKSLNEIIDRMEEK